MDDRNVGRLRQIGEVLIEFGKELETGAIAPRPPADSDLDLLAELPPPRPSEGQMEAAASFATHEVPGPAKVVDLLPPQKASRRPPPGPPAPWPLGAPPPPTLFERLQDLIPPGRARILLAAVVGAVGLLVAAVIVLVRVMG